ncbi:signal peptidase I [Leucothrix sargassi]|nr:signal peptidase I [Leucothrix sargassi]
MFYGIEFYLVLATLVCAVIMFIYRFVMGRKQTEYKDPLLVDYARSFLPVLLVVVFLRSFIIEPFRIPSGSMIPTLEIGDFVVVKKYAYGVKLPVINKKILDTGEPSRGDVVVFRYPLDPSINYIKRLVGMPGDHIQWTSDKKLLVNGELIPQKSLDAYPYTGSLGAKYDVPHVTETLPSEDSTREYNIILASKNPANGPGEWVVPEGQYFMMGDNRDNSNDSRFWGFVPEKYLVGEASMVWLHWNWQPGGDGFQFSRIGTSLN